MQVVYGFDMFEQMLWDIQGEWFNTTTSDDTSTTGPTAIPILPALYPHVLIFFAGKKRVVVAATQQSPRGIDSTPFNGVRSGIIIPSHDGKMNFNR